MTWSHRAQLEDGTLVEQGAVDQVVIPIDSGGEEENGEDEGADDKEEEEEDAGHVSLRPRSTTSRLPITAESTFQSLKGRMWGKTRDTKYGGRDTRAHRHAHGHRHADVNAHVCTHSLTRKMSRSLSPSPSHSHSHSHSLSHPNTQARKDSQLTLDNASGYSKS
jgi:hypothetical protein